MKLVFHPRAVKFLHKLPSKESARVLSKIELLEKTPIPANLDIKKLTTTQNSYRLRVGDIRVVFEIDTIGKISYIHDIDFRGSVY